MNFGFTSNTFRNIRDLEQLVNIAADCGADCIEWSGDLHVTDTMSAEKASELCRKRGIRICSYGSYYRVGSNNAEEWKSICSVASALGAGIIRVWLGSCDSEKTDDDTYKNLLEDVRNICSIAKEYGITVCPECHDNTFNNNTDAFLRIYRDAGCDNFGTYFQSRYKRFSYDMDRIKRTAEHIKCVHISFFDMRREQFPSYKPAYMNEIIKKLTEEGYDGDIIIEFTYPGFKAGFPFCLKRDMKRIKKIKSRGDK